MDAVSERVPRLAAPASVPVRRSIMAHDQYPLTDSFTGPSRKVRAVPGAARVGVGEAVGAASATGRSSGSAVAVGVRPTAGKEFAAGPDVRANNWFHASPATGEPGTY